MVAILAGTTAAAFEAYAVLAAMPLAAEELGGVNLYAWTFTMFVTGQVLAIVVAGRVCDRRGLILPLLVGCLTFFLGLVGAGAATNMLFLLLCRFFQGIGAGALNLALMVLIADIFNEDERPKMIMAQSFAWVGPSFFGPPISAWIATSFGWHWVFWAVAPFMLLAVAIGAKPLYDIREGLRRDGSAANPVPLWAAFVVTVGVAIVQFAAQQFDPEAGGAVWSLPVIGAVALVGTLLLGVSIPRLMPPGIFRFRPGIVAVMWVRAFIAGSFFIVESFVPLILVQQRGIDLVKAGLALTVGSIGWTFGSWLQARPWMRLRRDHLIVIGAACVTLGSAISLVFTTSTSIPVFVLLLGYVVSGVGMGFAVTGTSLANMMLSPLGVLGRNTSSLQVSEGLGNAMLVGFAGAIFAALRTTQPLNITFPVMLTVSVAGGLLALVFAVRIGRVQETGSIVTVNE